MAQSRGGAASAAEPKSGSPGASPLDIHRVSVRTHSSAWGRTITASPCDGTQWAVAHGGLTRSGAGPPSAALGFDTKRGGGAVTIARKGMVSDSLGRGARGRAVCPQCKDHPHCTLDHVQYTPPASLPVGQAKSGFARPRSTPLSAANNASHKGRVQRAGEARRVNKLARYILAGGRDTGDSPVSSPRPARSAPQDGRECDLYVAL